MSETAFDLAVIGAGPGGYVAAIRAAQLGMRVACIDKRGVPGGTCLNVGCIPSKALLHSSHKYVDAVQHFAAHGIRCEGLSYDLGAMMARKNKVVSDLTQGILYLFKKNKVEFFAGDASFAAPGELHVQTVSGETELIHASKILIASGSVPAALPGIEIDERRVVTSTGALALSEVPRTMIVVGGGYIGLEMGSIWARLGTQVTVVEYADRVVPAMDFEVGDALMKSLMKQGLTFRLGTKVNSAVNTGANVQAMLQPVAGGDVETVTADVLLACAGRRPFTDGLSLSRIGLQPDARGMIEINDHFETGVSGVYAIGDVVRGPMLAHKAEEEGVAVAERIAGQKPHINYGTIPAVVYTAPEVSTVGVTEEILKAQGTPYRVGKFPFSANSRGRANGDTEGFVKILAHAETDEVLGVHIMHSEAGTMIAEAAIAMEYKASAEDIARTCHAHPTVSEAVKEAALSALGRAIHS